MSNNIESFLKYTENLMEATKKPSGVNSSPKKKAPVKKKEKPDVNNLKPGDKVKLTPDNVITNPELLKYLPNPEDSKKIIELAKEIRKLEVQITKLYALKSKHVDAKDELENKTQDENLLKVLDLIIRDCPYALNEMRKAKKLLYRGLHKIPGEYFKGVSRENRNPKDSSDEAQKIVDSVLAKAGFKALRGNSIFTSSDYYQAENYGNTYMIFPIDGFSFTTSKYGDFYSDMDAGSTPHFIQNFFKNYIKDPNDLLGKSLELEFKSYAAPLTAAMKQVTKIYDSDNKLTYAQRNALSAINSLLYDVKYIINNTYYDDELELEDSLDSMKKYTVKCIQTLNKLQINLDPNLPKLLNSLILVCDKYLARLKNGLNVDELLSKLTPLAIQKIIKVHGFNNTDFAKALKSGHEIYISGAYYAIDSEHIDSVKKILKIK